MQSIANYLLVCHIFFLGYDESQKGYHCFDLISHKLYVSHHVFFFEHILLFFIPIESHNVFKSKLVHIDILLDDINSFHIDIDTLVPNHHAHFSPHMATLAPLRLRILFPYILFNVFLSLLHYHILFIPLIQILLHHF